MLAEADKKITRIYNKAPHNLVRDVSQVDILNYACNLSF